MMAKLLLNQLYGRFGMQLTSHKIAFLNPKELLARIERGDDITELFQLTPEKSAFSIQGHRETNFNTNIAIASAITAISRALRA